MFLKICIVQGIEFCFKKYIWGKLYLMLTTLNLVILTNQHLFCPSEQPNIYFALKCFLKYNVHKTAKFEEISSQETREIPEKKIRK